LDTSLRNRLLVGFLAMLLVVGGGATGYWFLGDGRWSFADCLYMTVITVTTVGYGETLVGMEHVAYARSFTVLLLVFGTGVLVYFASTITAFVVEGELKDMLDAKRRQKRIKKMKDHFVVCGAGSTGRHVINELLTTDHPVLAIDVNEAELREIAAAYPGKPFSFLVGDATDDEVLGQANIGSARGVACALSEDKDNLYLVVATRFFNASCRIIARCAEMSHVEKLKRAGADSVVSPNFIGGMRMVSEMVRPAVVRFLDEMLRDAKAAMRIEEVTLAPGCGLCGKTLREIDVRARFGMNVLAVKGGDGETWEYNPPGDRVLGEKMVLVVLGSAQQVRELRAATG
jgi:voltage-gated potassium channel